MKSPIRRRLFVAPHLDDGAISVGGTLLATGRRATKEFRTVVATVFSRSNYTKEGLGDSAKVTPIRQAEEKKVMGAIGVDTIFLDFLECPLRGYTISDPLDYPKLIAPELDSGLVGKVAECLDNLFQDFDEVIIPLGVGGLAHVDHRIVRQAATIAREKNPNAICRAYEDVPYVSRADRDRVGSLDGFLAEETAIDLEAKLTLIRGYESQPINAWEYSIRQAAGQPSVERMWFTIGKNALGNLARLA